MGWGKRGAGPPSEDRPLRPFVLEAPTVPASLQEEEGESNGVILLKRNSGSFSQDSELKFTFLRRLHPHPRSPCGGCDTACGSRGLSSEAVAPQDSWILHF